MAAQSADKDRKFKGVHAMIIQEFAVGTSATVYKGSALAMNTSTGRAVAASNVASRRFLGVCLTTKTTGDTDGTKKVEAGLGMLAEFDFLTELSNAYARVGKTICCETDNELNTATGCGTAAVRVFAGRLVAFTAAKKGYCWIGVLGDAIV